MDEFRLKVVQLTEKHTELQHEYAAALKENQELSSKVGDLKHEIQQLAQTASRDRALIQELQRSKDALSAELEDLTKNLIEEAGGMVAREAKQRHAIQSRQNALLHELEISGDLIATLQAQLLRKHAEESPNVHSDTPSPSISYEQLTGSMVEFAEKLQDSKLETWDSGLFHEFVRFLEQKEEHFLAFLKRLYSLELEGTLRGTRRVLKVPEKRIFDSLRKGECCIEPLGQEMLESELNESTTHSILNLFTSFALSSPTLALALPDEEAAGSPCSLAEPSDACGKRTPCGICGRTVSADLLKYKVRFSSSEQWLPLDTQCRARLVSVGKLVTFLRDIRNGHFDTLQPFLLYTMLLQLRREMFYARVDGTGFYLHSDTLHFKRFLLNKE